MYFKEDYTYHIYNRCNETVFFNSSNYKFFLNKIRKLIFPVAEILAWCIMPNHFHFLISANEKGIQLTGEKHRPELQLLSKNIGTLLSSYTQAINKQMDRKGMLFVHHTKAKQLNTYPHQTVLRKNNNNSNNYAFTCFNYIHQNPKEAGLVEKLEDWEYSSFRDYAGFRDGTLCNKELAYEIVNFDKDNFYEQSYIAINEKHIKVIW